MLLKYYNNSNILQPDPVFPNLCSQTNFSTTSSNNNKFEKSIIIIVVFTNKVYSFVFYIFNYIILENIIYENFILI